MIIACWSGPRNISTALMRSWSSRKDTYVTDEPFYSYYLNETKVKHPMHKEIIEKYSSNYFDIIKYLTSDIPNNKTIWYQKHMAHHMIDLSNIDWIKKCNNFILIRHPKQVISSYLLKNELNSIDELGYYQQFEIINFLKKNNIPFNVKESNEILTNPEVALKDWCAKIEINFDRSMLSWNKGIHPNDGVWAKHWYDNVINSSGFQKFKKKDISIENKYDSIYNDAMKYYKYITENI
tara:strand:+ start:611 stop:1321 length:711 start_codon:yes stop_codon:yes gene_type:complete